MRFREQQEQARVATRLLVALFALTVLLTVLGVNAALALAWRLQFGGFFGYPRWFFETNTAVTLGFVLGGAWLESLQLREGGPHVAALLGGREVADPQTAGERRLRNVVEEMAIATGLPPPRTFVVEREDAINAFAAGWEPRDSVIAVTRGALERLTRDELQGVVAHEFAHIRNGDTRLNMRLIGMVYGLQMVFTFGRSLMSAVDGRGRRAPTWIVGLALMAAGSIGWLAGRLLKAGVAREREHLADAAAVQFTRQPAGLGNALRKVAMQLQRGVRIRHVNAEVVSHLLLSSDAMGGGGWLATHPPIEERVRRIFGHDLPPLADDPLVDDEPATPAPRSLPPLPFTGVAPAAAAPVDGGSEDDLRALCASWPAAPLEAAVLALLLPTTPAPAQLQAWHDAVGGDGAAPRLLQAVRSLPAARRLPWFERLAVRAAALAPPRRAALLRRAREVVQAGGRVSLPENLQVRVLQQVLRMSDAPSAGEPAHMALAELAVPIAAVSVDLATLLPPPQRPAWVDAVLRGLSLPAVAAANAAPGALNGAVDRLALLARPQRPALVKQWLAALPGDGVPRDFADGLRCMCRLIDTPVPPQLEACFESPPVAAAAPAA